MPTSPNRSTLSDYNAEPIPAGTLGYVRARAKRRMFTVLVEEFQKSRVNQATIARRLNMDRSLVSRYLGTPANWEYETLCDFFFAMTGAVLDPTLAYPAQTSRDGEPRTPPPKPRIIEVESLEKIEPKKETIQQPPVFA
jgi:hypothetical protein